jgi:hypothetical protein
MCFSSLIIVMALKTKVQAVRFPIFDVDSTIITSAVVVRASAASSIEYGTITIELHKNDTAYLQFSSLENNMQRDWRVMYLYDAANIQVTETGYGIQINALRSGETFLQALVGDDIKNVALIKITE